MAPPCCGLPRRLQASRSGTAVRSSPSSDQIVTTRGPDFAGSGPARSWAVRGSPWWGPRNVVGRLCPLDAKVEARSLEEVLARLPKLEECLSPRRDACGRYAACQPFEVPESMVQLDRGRVGVDVTEEPDGLCERRSVRLCCCQLLEYRVGRLQRRRPRGDAASDGQSFVPVTEFLDGVGVFRIGVETSLIPTDGLLAPLLRTLVHCRNHQGHCRADGDTYERQGLTSDTHLSPPLVEWNELPPGLHIPSRGRWYLSIGRLRRRAGARRRPGHSCREAACSWRARRVVPTRCQMRLPGRAAVHHSKGG